MGTRGHGLGPWGQPVVFHLKSGHSCPNKKQYPLHQEGLQGIAPVIQKLIEQGLIQLCQTACNTPILPVKKGSGEYCMVQDLRAVNEATEDIQPVVLNPYTLLATLPLFPDQNWYSVLNLKDAFVCLYSLGSRVLRNFCL